MAVATSLRRVDLRFVLPLVPARASVLGDLPGWATGLAAAGVTVVDDPNGADLVVAPAALAAAAAASGASTVLLEGGTPVGKVLRRNGFTVTRLLALPRPDSPQYVVTPAHRAAAAYVGSNLPRWSAVGGVVLSWGVLPPWVPGSVTLGTLKPGPPALVAAARAYGAIERPGWSLVLGAGGVRKRAAFLLFEPGAREPSQALKFARAGESAPAFDRDERGLTAAARAGAVVAARAPRLVGRGEVAGFPFAIETAVPGRPLSRLLPSAAGMAVAEEVARWLDDVGRVTAHTPADLPAGLGELPGVPAVFVHQDLWPGNVFVHGERWAVVDWEHACPAGLPLSDLIFFAAHALAAGPAGAVALFEGRGRESPRLGRWVRAAATSLGLAGDMVGVLAALAWRDYGARARAARVAREQVTGRPVEPYLAEQLADAWVSNPALGPGWSTWRS